MIHLFEDPDEKKFIHWEAKKNFNHKTKTFSRFSLHLHFLKSPFRRRRIYSRRASGGINANIRAIARTGRLAMHLSTSRLIIRHGLYSRRQSLDSVESTCTALPSGNTLGKFCAKLLFDSSRPRWSGDSTPHVHSTSANGKWKIPSTVVRKSAGERVKLFHSADPLRWWVKRKPHRAMKRTRTILNPFFWG